MKASGLIAAMAAGVIGLTALSAQAAPINIVLHLTVTPNAVPSTGGTWAVTASISGATSSTAGLAGIDIDVVQTGAISVNDAVNSLNAVVELPGASSNFGFNFNNGTIPFTNGDLDGISPAGTQGLEIYGYQSPSNKLLSGGKVSVLSGVGLTAATQDGVSWALPVLVADGTYSGNSGTLQVLGSAINSDFLPSPVPPATSGGATISPIDTVGQLGGTITGNGPVPIGVPEPASLGLLGLGTLLVLRRRRTA